MDKETVKTVGELLIRVELCVLGIIRGIDQATLETRTVKVVAAGDEEEAGRFTVVGDEGKVLANFLDPLAEAVEWRKLIFLRVWSVMLAAQRWQVTSSPDDPTLTLVRITKSNVGDWCVGAIDREQLSLG